MSAPDTSSLALKDLRTSEIHAVPKKSAFRRAFSRLHPLLQLVFLQMWMPVFMSLMFILCYVLPFHHVAPHDVPVGVVGESSEVAKIQEGADAAMPGGWDFSLLASDDEAETRVRSGEIVAAYDLAEHELIIASAHQAQAASLVPRYLEQLLQLQEAPKVNDLAPLRAGDLGMTPMYLMLSWCITGYLSAMFIGLMGAPLKRTVRFAVIAGGSIVLSFLTSFLVSVVIGAIDASYFFRLWGLGAAWSAAIGVAVNGLSYFCGRFIAAPSMLIFIFLSIPSSGAAMPQWFMPEPFRWLNHVVVGSGITEMLKRIVYDVGPGYARGWLMLLGYLVVGLLLTLIGKPYWEWLRVRRMLQGKTTMMQDAQRANGRLQERDRSEILGHYGLEPGPEGAVIVQGARSRVATTDAAREGFHETFTDSFSLGRPLSPSFDEDAAPEPGSPNGEADRNGSEGDEAERRPDATPGTEAGSAPPGS